MSSSPPAETRTVVRRKGFRVWSLRARLLGTLVLLLAVACAVIGVATEVVVYQVQVRKLDKRLAAAGLRTEDAFGEPREGPKDGHDRPPPIQGPGTLAAIIDDGHIYQAQVLDIGGHWQPLSAADAAVLSGLPIDGRAHTRTLGARGDYRLLASGAPNGSVIITGLSLDDVYAMQYELAVIEVGVGLAALLIAGLAGAVIMRTTLRPLRRVAGIAGRVAELPLDRGEVALSLRVSDVDTDPRTEVGQVGAALNRMLGHIANALSARQASEARVRKFVADASHELRTPLASIRGYAELTRRNRGQVPAEVAHALGRVESEAVRMTDLVEDLLLLARLDSGRPVERQPVDLSAIVVDAVSDAHAAGPGHGWQLDLPGEPVTVTGDQGRLHQVVANLLANTRQHTPAGTVVTVSLAAGDEVVLRVADNGPGIPLELQPEVFERFTRADTSRSRASGSTGLGLAIVAAVVEAHRGTVEVDSAPGHTAFTIRLPREH